MGSFGPWSESIARTSVSRSPALNRVLLIHGRGSWLLVRSMKNTVTYAKFDGTVPFNDPATVSGSVVLDTDDRSSGDLGLIDDGTQEAAPRRAPRQARMRCGLIAEG